MKFFKLVSVAAVVLTAACAQIGQQQGKGVTTCDRTEKIGCFELDFVAVKQNGTPEIQNLLGSGVSGTRSAFSGQKGLAMKIYQAAESGRVTYHEGCFPLILDFWKSDTAVSNKQMSVYSLNKGKPGRGNNPTPKKVGPFHYGPEAKGVGKSVQYKDLTVCGGKGAFQVPWSFLPEGSFVKIEPLDNTIFPVRTKGKNNALYITKGEVDRARADEWEYVIVPIIFP